MVCLKGYHLILAHKGKNMCAEQAEDRVCENADTKHQLMIIIIKQNAASTKQII